MLYICPSRGRPDNAYRLVREWEKTRTFARLLIALDDDDPTLNEYLNKFSAEHNDWLGIAVQPRMRLGGTLNHHAKTAVDSRPYETSMRILAGWSVDTDIIGFLGDDHVPRTHGFDARVKSAMDSMGGTGVVYGNDLLQGQALPTAVAISSNVIQALDYMVPPGMTHLFLDNAWGEMGKSMERYTYLPDVIIEHIHPANGKAEWDPGYVEVNSGEMWNADEAAYKAWMEDGTYRAVLRKLVGG